VRLSISVAAVVVVGGLLLAERRTSGLLQDGLGDLLVITLLAAPVVMVAWTIADVALCIFKRAASWKAEPRGQRLWQLLGALSEALTTPIVAYIIVRLALELR